VPGELLRRRCRYSAASDRSYSRFYLSQAQVNGGGKGTCYMPVSATAGRSLPGGVPPFSFPCWIVSRRSWPRGGAGCPPS
jgi:hypothetical protein